MISEPNIVLYIIHTWISTKNKKKKKTKKANIGAAEVVITSKLKSLLEKEKV